MANVMKVADLTAGAALLKKLVERSDANRDGAVRWEEARWGVDRQKGIGVHLKRGEKFGSQAAQAIESAVRFTQGTTGSSQIKDIKTAITELSRRVRAGDRDKDGFISEAEARRFTTGGESQLALFTGKYAKKKLEDFVLPVQRDTRLPAFSWKGSAKQVTSSLLNAFSDRKNDNFWGRSGGASRFVLGADEAKKMVAALKPLYPSRQEAVLTELSSRTLESKFGCVSVNAGARAVFEKYAQDLGVTGLEFLSPKAPPAPPH